MPNSGRVNYFHYYIHITTVLLLQVRSPSVSSRITSDNLYYFFVLLNTPGLLVLAMCDRAAWVATKPLWWLHIYYTYLVSPRFEHSLCSGSFITAYITIIIWLVVHISSMVPAMCNLTSLVQVDVLPQNQCGNNCERTLFSWLHIHYVHLVHAVLEY